MSLPLQPQQPSWNRIFCLYWGTIFFAVVSILLNCRIELSWKETLIATCNSTLQGLLQAFCFLVFALSTTSCRYLDCVDTRILTDILTKMMQIVETARIHCPRWFQKPWNLQWMPAPLMWVVWVQFKKYLLQLFVVPEAINSYLRTQRGWMSFLLPKAGTCGHFSWETQRMFENKHDVVLLRVKENMLMAFAESLQGKAFFKRMCLKA